MSNELKTILDFYLPLVAQLPSFRNDSDFMQAKVKAIGESGVTDVVTKTDEYVQEQIKSEVNKCFPDWQFWGEEGKDKITKLEESKSRLFIIDPIEGTNNFRFGIDDFWGSVVAVVDIKTNTPIIGIVAQPAQNRIFYAEIGKGARVAQYDTAGKIVGEKGFPSQPEHHTFTYNNSPHFSKSLMAQVDRLFFITEVLPAQSDNTLSKSRKSLMVKIEGKKKKLVDVEAGAIEPMLFEGGIMFKTSAEMAAVFVILNEIKAEVSTAQGNGWSIDMNSLIFARDRENWKLLKKIYDLTLE